MLALLPIRCASVIASAAAVASSSIDAFAIAMPVRSHTIVWKLTSASSRPCEISGWYGVYAVYHAGLSRTLRWMTAGRERAVVALPDERFQRRGSVGAIDLRRASASASLIGAGSGSASRSRIDAGTTASMSAARDAKAERIQHRGLFVERRADVAIDEGRVVFECCQRRGARIVHFHGMIIE